MTKKPIHNTTTSTRTKSPKRQTIDKATKKKTSSAGSPTVRPKAKRRRPPRRATQEQIQMTFAAAKARDIIHDHFVDLGETGSLLHQESLRFMARYFRQHGVRVSREGHVIFPARACAGVDLERLLEQSYVSTHDFLEALDKETGVYLLDGSLDELHAMAWRLGFFFSRDHKHPEQWIVPVVLGLNVSTGNFHFNNFGDRAYVPDSDLPPAQQAFASQLPKLWERWQAEKARRSLMHTPGNTATS